MPGVYLARDECIRDDTTPATLAGLQARPSVPDGTVTAGNASPLNDGAAALLLGTEKAAERSASGRWPASPAAGRSRSSRTGSGSRPIEAAEQALARAGTAAPRSSGRAQRGVRGAGAGLPGRLAGRPRDRQPQGGAIAIGHPLGASGARLLGTLSHRLRESGERWGVAALCIGVGQGLAVVLENELAGGAL